MSKLVVKVSDLNTSNITIGDIKLLESGGKACSLSYNYGGTTKSLTTQVGPLSLPFGINKFDKAGPIKYSIELSLRGYEEDDKVRRIYQAFTALDNWMIEQGVKNSRAWFKEDYDAKVIKAFYTPMIKVAKGKDGKPNLKYPPTIKVNLKKDKDGSFEVKTYNTEGRPYTDTSVEEILVKGSKITTIMQCTSIWISGSKFGLSWKATQIRMEAIPESMPDYAFLDDEGSNVARTTSSTNAQNTFASLDDEDGEVEDDDAFQDAPVSTGPSNPVVKKPSVLAAVMNNTPPAPQETIDDQPEDHEPLPLPTVAKKATTTTTVKKVIKTVGKK